MQNVASIGSPPAAAAERAGATLSDEVVASIAGATVLAAIGGDALLFDGFVGIAFPMAALLMVAIAAAVVWRTGGSLSREAAAWLGTAVLFSTGLAWRDSVALQGLDIVVTLASFIMAAVAIGNSQSGLFARTIRDTMLGVSVVIRAAVGGFLPLVLRRSSVSRSERTRHAGRRVVRNVAIAGTLIIVFGGLLRDADPIFASIVALPNIAWETIVHHLVVIAAVAWAAAGWSRGAVGGMRAPPRFEMAFNLDATDITVALGTLNVLFATFVVVQLGWFFGGEQFLRDRTGLTAAAYARGGFFQMAWVALLVVPVLLITRAALVPGRALARRHTLLALPIIALLAVMIASSALRMRLYIRYFGMTTDRLYPMVFMAWLCVVLLWLAVTVLRGWPRPWLAGAVASGLATLAALHVFSPDAIIARINVARAQRSAAAPSLDIHYLSRLSAEAADVATDATLRARNASFANERADGVIAPVRTALILSRCDAASTLLRRWGPQSRAAIRRSDESGAWRYWNLGETRALRIVSAHSAALRTVMHETCTPPNRNADGSARAPSPAPSRGSAAAPTTRGN